MSTLPMTTGDIRKKYREGTAIPILAELNATNTSIIKAIVQDLIPAPEPKLGPLPELKPAAEDKSEHKPKAKEPAVKLDVVKAKELYDEKKCDREIAEALGVTLFMVWNWRKKNNYPAHNTTSDAGRISVAKRQGKPATENKEFAEAVQPMFDEAKKVHMESGPLPSVEQAKEALKMDIQRAAQFATTGNDAPIQPVEETSENRIPPVHAPEDVKEVALPVVDEDAIVEAVLSDMKAQQAKHDVGKPRLSLVPPSLIEAVGRVRTYETDKYGSPDNWKTVRPWRYKDAMMRHLCEYLRDPNSVDEESGLPHLEHLACNVAFLLEFRDQERRDAKRRGLFDCDPNKNAECSKRSCYLNGGGCSLTHNSEAARDYYGEVHR